MTDRPDETHWRTAGDRIQSLLDASAIGGAAARERAEHLVGEVSDLYGVCLQRMMHIAARSSPALADEFAADDLVASLMLVHGLHPHSVEHRIAVALDGVRPYLGSHGGDVHLLDVLDGADGAVVRLRLSGSCKTCPSSAVTLELAVEDAVRTAAPEVTSIEVVAADPEPSVIPVESLVRRIHSRPRTQWEPAPALAELATGEVGGFRVGGVAVVACRVGDELLAYRERCGHCTSSLAGAKLAEAVLSCPHCGTGFDVVHAGAAVGGDDHLDPVPVLVRDGVPSIALTEAVP